LETILKNNGYDKKVVGMADHEALMKGAVKAFNIKEPRFVGMIITGKYGCGKTHFVRSLGMRCDFIDMTLPTSVKRLADNQWCDSEVENLLNHTVVIDDMGAECIRNEYGVKHDVVGEFICQYHRLGKGRLFITTNLTGSEMLDRYGGRVVDRLKQLCVPVRMTGESKREWL
jgi:DNA replication protein DnaC